MTTQPFRCEVYDKAFAPVGPVGKPISVTIIPRHMMPGMTTIVLPGDHPRVADLIEPGARMWFRDRKTDQHLMSGWVTRFRVTGPARRSQVSFDIIDDAIIFQRILGWVRPDQPISSQGGAGTNWTMTDNAETVFKAALQQNGVDRLGLPIEIPADEGRGAVVKARLRFQSLYDRLIPVEDGAGIINSGICLGMQQNPEAPGLLLNTWEPRVITKILNESSGIVREWGMTHDNASMTRGVAGGEGEGELRLLREKVDSALEAAFGWKFEAFRDARDTNDPDTMYERIDESLAENAAKSGLTIELSETANFMASPDKLWVGDQVRMGLGDLLVEDRLEEVTLSSTATGGYVSRSRVGDRSDDPDRKLAKMIRAVTRKLRVADSDI